MRIICDVDQVVAHMHPEWLGRYNRDFGDTLRTEDLRSWAVSEHVKPEARERIFDYLQDPDLYDNVEPVVGALEGIVALRQAGDTVVFASACTFAQTDQKVRWLVRHGFLQGNRHTHHLPRDFVAIQDKTLLQGDVLIDDSPHTIKAWTEGMRRTSIMLQYSYNQALDMTSAAWLWCHRAATWADVVAIAEGLR